MKHAALATLATLLFIAFTQNALAQSQGSFSATNLEQDSLSGSQEWKNMNQGATSTPTSTSSVAGCYSTVQNGQPVQICPYSGQSTGSVTGANAVDWGSSPSAQSAAAEKAAQAAAQQAAGNGSGGNQNAGNSGDNNNTAPAQSAQPTSASAATGPSCQQAQELANQCCNNPSACLLSSNSASQSSSMATAMIQMALGVGANLPGNVAGMCGQAKDVSYVSSALNVYLANQCRAAVSNCDSACASNPGYVAVCNQNSGAELSMAAGAIAAQFAAKMDQQCQNAVQAQQNSFDNPNCSTTAEASTPFCQYQCNRPGAQADPNCAGIIAAMQNQNGINPGLTVNNNSGASTNPFGGAIPPTQANQQQVPPCVSGAGAPCGGSANNNQNAGAGAGMMPQDPYGMGMQPPLGSSGGTGSGNGTQAQAPEQGWNTSILKGITSGNGYTGPAMTTGGAGGYATTYNAQGQHLNPFGQPFDLKDFLPGGKYANKMPRANPLRGLASQAKYADINPPSRDIFQEISDRYYDVCLHHMLFEGPCQGLIRYYHKQRHFTSPGAATDIGEPGR